MYVRVVSYLSYVRVQKLSHKNHKQEIKINNYNRAQGVSTVLILLVHICDSFYARVRNIV